VVLLEVLTGRQAIDYKRSEKEQCLVEWAKPYLKPGIGFYQLMDPKLQGQFSPRGAYKAMKLVSLCLSPAQKSRPKMSEIVKMLQYILHCNCDMPMPTLTIKSSHAGPSSYNSTRHGGNHVNKHPTRFKSHH
jgi:hypothetical protein